jgi:hypothetical protein
MQIAVIVANESIRWTFDFATFLFGRFSYLNSQCAWNVGVSLQLVAPMPHRNTPLQRSLSILPRSSTQCVIALLSFVNIGLAGLMGALGILALIKLTPESASSNLTATFLSVYMVIFALLLFLYELIWWQPFPSLNKMFRMNFGFMYGLKGKGFYLIFIAFLCLGLRDAGNVASIKGLDWATGLGWLGVGVFHVFISCTWPEANDSYKPPSTGFNEPTPDPNVV